MARPKKPKADRRSNVLRIRLTEAERRVIEKAAQKEALDASAWARRTLLIQGKGGTLG